MKSNGRWFHRVPDFSFRCEPGRNGQNVCIDLFVHVLFIKLFIDLLILYEIEKEMQQGERRMFAFQAAISGKACTLSCGCHGLCTSQRVGANQGLWTRPGDFQEDCYDKMGPCQSKSMK